MKSLLKKLTFSFLTALIVFVSVAPNLLTAKAAKTAAAPTASAAPTWYNSSFKDWYGKVYDPNNPSEIFGERYTAAQVQWVIYGIWGFLINSVTGPQNAGIVQCFLNGVTDISTCTSQLKNLVTYKAGDVNLADAQFVKSSKDNLWSEVFATNRQLSGISYIRNVAQNFSLVPVAHAAPTVGFGFGALGPVQGMWAAVRDIAFGLFVIVAIVFSFMIMFRVKLSPQTVISVQSALPKIITALVLVTFSYAIAGFLIDLMYVFIGLTSIIADGMFKSVGLAIGPTPYFNFMTLGQPLGGWWSLLTGSTPQAGVFMLIVIYFVLFFLPLLIFLLIVGLPLLAIPGAGAIIYIIFAVLLFIIAFIIAIVTGIKIIWALLKAFVNIVLLTIFSPVYIAAGTVIPSLGFGQWVRSFVSNLAVFVVTGALFLFAFFFTIPGLVIGFKAVAGVATLFLNPLLGAIALGSQFQNFVSDPSWPPLLGSGSDAFVGLLFFGVSFVLFTLTPKAAEIIQGLMSGKPFAYGSAIGEAFGAVGAAYSATGAKDIADSLMMARRINTMERFLKKNKAQVQPVVKAVTGGDIDQAKQISEELIRHR